MLQALCSKHRDYFREAYLYTLLGALSLVCFKKSVMLLLSFTSVAHHVLGIRYCLHLLY
jgi:hypothetical protein